MFYEVPKNSLYVEVLKVPLGLFFVVSFIESWHGLIKK